MYKALKIKFRNWKLKQQLIKHGTLFSEDNFVFKDVNVLLIDEIMPEFNKDSGSRRLTEIIKLLLKNDISVFLVADLKQHKYKSDYIQKFKNLGVNVYEPSVNSQGELVTKEEFIKQMASKMQIAWLHRPLIFDKFQDLIKTSNPDIKLVFDMVDFHYVRLLREYELHKDESLKKEAEKFLNIELQNCKNADVVIAISTTDQAMLKQHFNEDEKVILISNIHQHLGKAKNFKNFQKRKDLLFVGSFRHDPNIDAVNYLITEIMPLVWKELPEVNVNVIGSYVTEDIKALATDRFHLLGFVENLTMQMNSSKLFVAPLRFGAGIKGKIGQSLEHSLPLVTSDIGAEGFDFGSQKEVMIANTAEDTAQKIIDLYTNEALWNKASDSCEAILKPFSLTTTEAQILKIIND